MVTRNIIIQPPPDVAEQAMEWSRQIATKYKTDFVLDGKITLYQGAYPDNNVAEIETQLSKLVKTVGQFQVKTSGLSTMAGFISLNFEKNEELVALHRTIVGTCNPLREGLIIPDEEKNLTNPNIPDFIKYSIRTYGSALDMDAFAPHITITRLQNFTEPAEATQLIKYNGMSF
ncbi:MAG: hypothetical protein NTY06_03475, partial [Candidatus Gottesmanbacteria bacterium]|nr:hypothetical protein [Candidatus Gottesmanbacteria bacterium]